MGFFRNNVSWPSRLAQSRWAFAGVLILAAGAYWPGLAGGFLFDDFVNLPALGAGGRIDSAEAFWRYITSGTADPTGRPISLLSFLLDARNWPADPAPFLRTSLLLHLLNGALLFLLLRLLEDRLGVDQSRASAVATLGAGLWILHPIFVSTTLYIVQREAMLPATFTLCGLLAWVRGRDRLARGECVGSIVLVAAFGLCTVLATLSKANGILLPLLAWVVDATLLRPKDSTEAWRLQWTRMLRAAMLIVPSLLVFAVVAWGLRYLGEPFETRSWTLEERLLTEPRVLLDYLQLLAVPRVLSTGLYNDAYTVSTGMLYPWSTLPALLAVVGMVIAAFYWRRAAPTLAASLLFFFSGHLLESTTIPLELYFEHRNYLPAMLLGWPLARAISRIASHRARVGLSAAVLLLFAFITWQRAALWAQQEQMAYLWAAKNPASSRAQATAAIFETRSGRPDLAAARLADRVKQNPRDLQLVLNRVNARCSAGGLLQEDVETVATALSSATEGHQLVHRWLEQSLTMASADRCSGLNLDVVSRWLEAARSNPSLQDIPGRQQDLNSIAGQMAIARGNPEQALPEFNRALDADPTPQVALRQAAFLATQGCYREALSHLDRFEAYGKNANSDALLNMQTVHRRLLEAQEYWPTEIARLRETIQGDLRKEDARCGR